jgi:hypothetical protein
MANGAGPKAPRSGRVPPARRERASGTHSDLRSTSALRFRPMCCAISYIPSLVIVSRSLPLMSDTIEHRPHPFYSMLVPHTPGELERDS